LTHVAVPAGQVEVQVPFVQAVLLPGGYGQSESVQQFWLGMHCGLIGVELDENDVAQNL
jgi:hypothetical protein